MKTLKPTNQKSVYHSFANIYEQGMKKEDLNISLKALSGMTKVISEEIKIAKVRKKDNIRSIELKDFSEYDD